MDISVEQVVRVFDLKLNKKRKNIFSGFITSYEGQDNNDNPKFCSWYCNFVGKAFYKAKKLEQAQEIILLRAKIDNSYNRDTDKFYVNVTVYDFKPLRKEIGEDNVSNRKRIKGYFLEEL